MITQTEIANRLKVTNSTVSYILNGKRPVSWPLAVKLAKEFPGKDVVGWKNATPEELWKAFSSMESGIKQNKKKNKKSERTQGPPAKITSGDQSI